MTLGRRRWAESGFHGLDWSGWILFEARARVRKASGWNSMSIKRA
jgi:hypothetical protein